jgi:hypothetical protein
MNINSVDEVEEEEYPELDDFVTDDDGGELNYYSSHSFEELELLYYVFLRRFKTDYIF